MSISRYPKGCCNSSFFYIKPQLHHIDIRPTCVVIHPFSTSNHNVGRVHIQRACVVIHPFSTSNHNGNTHTESSCGVVIHPFSTSNHNILGFVWGFLGGCNSSFFYIKPQQSAISAAPPSRCNSSFFYIKPQRQADD